MKGKQSMKTEKKYKTALSVKNIFIYNSGFYTLWNIYTKKKFN